jgi:hypothetical protein
MQHARNSPEGGRMSGQGIRLAGGLLVATAVAFVGVFGALAARFDYPDVLARSTAEVLPALLAGGTSLRILWWLYSLLPIALLPAAVAAFESLRDERESLMRVGTYCAVLASLTLTLGLIRWPSLNYELATIYATATPEGKAAVEVVFAGFNRYLGTYVGEQLGEIFLNAWFIAVAVAMAGSARFPRWVAWAGMTTGVLGLIGMFRFATTLVAPVAAANNILLPLWLVVFGVALFRYGARATSSTSARELAAAVHDA